MLKFFAVLEAYSAQLVIELSPTFAMLLVTPILGLKELTTR